MILADDETGRRQALATILPMQRADFEEIFEIMAGLPVTIRLLDPPLHEFLPQEEREIDEIAAELGVPVGKAAGAHRGAVRVQPDARLPRLPPRHPLPGDHRDAGARHLRGRAQPGKETGKPVKVEIMVPLVAYRREFEIVREIIVNVARGRGRDGAPSSTIRSGP